MPNRFIALLLAFVVVSCAAPKATLVTTPIAPTVTVPVPTKRVELKQLTEDLKPVVEANRKLGSELDAGKRAIFQLNQKLAAVQASQMATIADWQRLKELGKETETSLEQSELHRATQASVIEYLQGTIAAKSSEVFASESEKETLRAAVATANQRITELTKENTATQAQWQTAKADVDVVKGALKTETAWKWRFFWWGSLVSAAWVVFVAIKIYT